MKTEVRWRAKRRLDLLFIVWLVLLSILHGTTKAENLPHNISLERYALLLINPTGAMTIDEVALAHNVARFTQLQKPLSLGFTSSVAWVKIVLMSDSSSQWLLEVGQPILDDVRLYQRTQQVALQVRHGTLTRSSLVNQYHVHPHI